VVLSEAHLRRLLTEYVEYYNTERVDTSLGDTPAGRATDVRPSDRARVVGLPRVGGSSGNSSTQDPCQRSGSSILLRQRATSSPSGEDRCSCGR
jgi:transposase InsO family protein